MRRYNDHPFYAVSVNNFFSYAGDIFRLHTTHPRVQIKIIYTFRMSIWRPSWISHFTQAIYYYILTHQIYFGYHLICISASSVPMNHFYLLQLFVGDFLKYVCGLFEIVRNYSMIIHFWALV